MNPALNAIERTSNTGSETLPSAGSFYRPLPSAGSLYPQQSVVMHDVSAAAGAHVHAGRHQERQQRQQRHACHTVTTATAQALITASNRSGKTAPAVR